MGTYQGVIDLDTIPANWRAHLAALCARYSVADGPHVRWIGRTRNNQLSADPRPILRAYLRDWPVRQFVWWQAHGAMARHSLRLTCGLVDCVAAGCLTLYQPVPTIALSAEELAAVQAAAADGRTTLPRATASAARRRPSLPAAPPRWCSRCYGNILPTVEWDEITGTAVEWRCLQCNELAAARPVTLAEARRLALGA